MTTLTSFARLENKVRHGIGAGVALGGAALAGSAAISSSANKKAAKKVANAYKDYEKVDLDELQSKATSFARQNAINSLNLERELTPDVARTRETYNKQVADELQMGGKLSADVTNQVTKAGQYDTGNAGLYGGAGPITAAMLGTTAQDLKTQRQNRAAVNLSANELPSTGLSPETLASVAVGDQNAINNLRMAGINAQANSTAANGQIWGSTVKSIGSMIAGGL